MTKQSIEKIQPLLYLPFPSVHDLLQVKTKDFIKPRKGNVEIFGFSTELEHTGNSLAQFRLEGEQEEKPLQLIF